VTLGEVAFLRDDESGDDHVLGHLEANLLLFLGIAGAPDANVLRDENRDDDVSLDWCRDDGSRNRRRRGILCRRRERKE
jgi:hypothetical protein